MWIYVLLAVLALLLLTVAVVLIRTLSFKPKPESELSTEEVFPDTDRAVESLAEMIRCRTVSDRNSQNEDNREFLRFEEYLRSRYPRVHEKLTLERISDRALLYKWSGKTDLAPTVLMSHYDVVSVEESGWTKPPFGGVVEDGYLFGRGTLDTKGSLMGILEAAESLLGEGFVPESDVYFAFGGNEEINGDGAASIARLFLERGITPALVLDEGGAVVEKVFPGVSGKCAMVGIAEKGMLNVEYSVTGGGGHASSPKPHTPVGILSAACVRVENKPFTFRISEPARQLFDTLARHSSFFYRIIFANLWLFSPVLDLITRKSGGELNALVRTTTAFTQMEGSKGINVIPAKARMTSNHRLMSGDTTDSVLASIRKTVNDPRVEVRMIDGMNPSVISVTDSDGYEKVKNTIRECWNDTLVSPYLLIACSDSRHWGAVTDKVFRFSPMYMTNEERATIHGNDERISIDGVSKLVEFYLRLIKKL